MVFNGDANDQDICTLADGKGGSNDVSFPLKQKSLYANMKAREALRAIWDAYCGWIQDGGYGAAVPAEPEVLLTLSITPRYVYPVATAQYIDAVEAKDATGNWYPLKPITLEDIQAQGIAETAFNNTPSSTMQYYRLVENGIRTYPDSNVATANALKIRQRADINVFTPTSTTATPPWDSVLHEGLAIGMALEYAKDNSLPKAAQLTSDWNDFISSLKNHVRNKFGQIHVKFKKRPNAVGQYI